ncbi:uncharacterized protein LOC116303367, partial [Actinia tenebrosa]|uniref:Uncharacterized protein LOC116303367 n=1 Tax=Actinia tenebrosa TaxID=6105 RepID=A0A6P8IQS1_ACTTE
LEDWIADAQRSVAAQKLTGQEAVDFLYHSLEGAARDEVRLRPVDDWTDPDGFFRILRDVFGEKLTKTQLLQRFFARKQGDREPIQDFAHALMSMAEHITRVHVGALENKDQNLRDTFVENLRDNLLRRDLKRYIREHPEKTFNEVRQEAYRSSEDTDRGAHRHAAAKEVLVESNQVNAIQELTAGQKALVERLMQQQKLLDEQQKLLTQLTMKLASPSPPRSPPRGPRRCYNCHELGHLRPNCPKPLKDKAPAAPQKESNSSSPQQ